MKMGRNSEASPRGSSPTPERRVLESLLGLSSDEAEVWQSLVEAAKREGTMVGRAMANRFANRLKARSLVPLDAEEDLPPHVVGRVSLTGTEASVIHSFDLDNLSQFPRAMEALVQPEPTEIQIESFREFLEKQTDEAYLRRVVLGRTRLRAETLLREALRQRPALEEAHHLLLDLFESEGRWEEAEGEARRYASLPLAPQAAATARLDLAEVLSAQDRWEEAVAALDPPLGLPTYGPIGEGLGHFRAAHQARALRTIEDVSHWTEDLVDFLGMTTAEAGRLMPGALDEAIETYGALPEWIEVMRAGLEDSPLETTLSFHLYFAFAHRSAEWPDPPAEALGRGSSVPYALARLVDLAIHGSRHGQFQVVETLGTGPGRRLLRAQDVLSREELEISFAPSTAPDDPLDRVGALFRAHLVPWGNLWFCRGPVEILPGPVDAPLGPIGPRLWFAAVANPQEEFWASYVIEGSLGLVSGIEAEHYEAPGPVRRALEMAYRTNRRLPDLLVTADGFPFVDPSGRTATSWREPVVTPFAEALSPADPSARKADGGAPLPHAVSLLKPWVETFGIRHVTDPQAVARVTREFQAVIEKSSSEVRVRQRSDPRQRPR
jgi:hypothetical protein